VDETNDIDLRGHGQPQRITVVIVDDEDRVRWVLRHQLEDSDHDIEVVDEGNDGHAAIALAAADRPDVLIIDVDMPGLGGVDALPAVKAASPNTRVIVLTGTGECSRSAAMAAGADAYLRKPTSLDQLVGTVKQLGPAKR
jgi:YesN/AraC family two-component response regulator